MLFVRVCSICACLVLSVSLPLGVWEGLRFVIVALPGLFSYPFFGNTGFAEEFKRIVNYKTIDNDMNVLQQTAFVFFNPIMLKTIIIRNS